MRFQMTEKRFTVPVKYCLSHSKIQLDGEPLTNEELVRICNTNDGAFTENFALKQEIIELKKENEQLKSENSNLRFEMGVYEQKIEDVEKENEELKQDLQDYQDQVKNFFIENTYKIDTHLRDDITNQFGVEF